MKILYVTTISNTVNAFLIPHIKMLIDQGNQVDIACNIVQEINPEVNKMGCLVYNLDFNRSPMKMQNYLAYKKLKEIIRNGQYDLIHTHTPTASACVRLACKNISNVRVIYTAHGFHFYKGASILNWLIYFPIEKHLSKYTDCLITINEEDYHGAKHHFKLDNVERIHGVGVDLSYFRPVSIEEKNKLREKHGYGLEDFILIYPAELNKNKNQGLLINVLAQLKLEIPNVKLLLPGKNGIGSTYISMAKSLGVDDTISFLGHRKDINELLALSDIGIASSIREGLGINLVEAMATGLPVIASDNRGHRELVQSGENGILFKDEISAIEAVKRLYNNQEERLKMGLNSREFSFKYSIEKTMSEMIDIYSKYT